MTFNSDKPIYVQMVDRLCDEILAGKYQDDDRIPSVREYGVLLEVNANTAVKAYDELARANIIYNKRGVGYFVTPGAKKQILKERKRTFMKERLPELFRQMQLLGISIDDVAEAYKKNERVTFRHKYAQNIPKIL
jgi:DNA-binding transcriptional regulator YhcF (GntR family)